MRTKLALLSSAAAAAISLAAPAQADHYYVSFFGGISSVDGDELAVGPFSYFSRISTNPNTIMKTIPGVKAFPLWTAAYGYIHVTGGRYTLFRTQTVFASTYASGFLEDQFDTGFVVGAAFGIEFNDGWRTELELAWRQNDLGGNHRISGSHHYGSNATYYWSVTGSIAVRTQFGSTTKSGIYTSASPYTITRTRGSLQTETFQATAQTSGRITAFSLMANFWYDWSFSDESPIHPFVGAGIGVANLAVDYSGKAVLPENMISYVENYGPFQNTASFATDTDDYVFAWQLVAGLAYEFGNGMSLSAQYRYFATGDITVAGQDFAIQSHEALIGLRVPLGN